MKPGVQCVLCARLAGGHKATVTKLVAIGGKDASSPEQLVSAAADGTVALWDPSSASTSKEVAPVATTKPHESEIFSMVVSAASTDSLDGGGLHLVTSGTTLSIQQCDSKPVEQNLNVRLLGMERTKKEVSLGAEMQGRIRGWYSRNSLG